MPSLTRMPSHRSKLGGTSELRQLGFQVKQLSVPLHCTNLALQSLAPAALHCHNWAPLAPRMMTAAPTNQQPVLVSSRLGLISIVSQPMAL